MLVEIVSASLNTQTIFRTLLFVGITLLLFISVFKLISYKTSAKDQSRLLLGARDLPSLPFQWPNGQGTEKFFNGRRAARKWRSEYGPMYSIWSGFKREIVLTTPEHVQVFFKDSHTHIKATDNNSGWLFGELLGSCVGLVSQKEWQKVRRPFETHFTRVSSVKRTASFVVEATRFLDKLDISERRMINTTDDLKYCPFFMVASIFFGVLTAEQREILYALGPPRELLFRDTFKGGMNRYALGKYLPGSSMRRLNEFQQQWESFMRQTYEEAIRKGDGAIVPLFEAMQGGDMSMRQLLQTLDESLFANLDVTAHAVSWNVIRIAQHTDMQQQVRLEMQGHGESDAAYEEYLGREDTLLAAFILEVSRLHPILPFSNPEAANVDKLIDGYLIPRNTDVIVDAYAINVDNPYWQDSSTFDPYRHLGQKDQARRYNMWRFGFGPRQCLGKNVADIILRVIVAELLKRFKLELVQEDGMDGVELQAESWIGLPDGIVRLTPT